jgi:hypothetical protein
MVVGAYRGQGAAYIFERLSIAWTQTAKLQASGAAQDAAVGGAVAIFGDIVLVNSEDDDSGAESGCLFPFSLPLMVSRIRVCLRQRSGLDLVGADKGRGCRWCEGRPLRPLSGDQCRLCSHCLSI